MQYPRPRGLSGSAIKLIAAAMMLLDHIAWYWFPLSSSAGFIMHTLGRITAPVMCFFIAEGYYMTRSVARYALRLFAFAVIAQPAFCFYTSGVEGYGESLNVLFTLALGLLALRAVDSSLLPRCARILLAALCCAASYFCDWSLLGVALIVIFGACRGDFRRQALALIIATAALLALAMMAEGRAALYRSGILLALPLLRLYNGARGGTGDRRGRAAAKYAFYLFYPLHMLLLALLRGFALI